MSTTNLFSINWTASQLSKIMYGSHQYFSRRNANPAGTFGCTIGVMPFTYLELPLGTTKPSVEDHAPIISKIERRLSLTGTFLALARRVTYINSAVRSMPIYAMCTLKLHVIVLDHVDKLCRAILWRGK